MLAIDTNVIVRYLTGDHPGQAARARRLVDGGAVWVSTTVLLETEWVLRSAYSLARAQVAAALRRFAGLPTVSLENPQLAAQALTLCELGVDFADALHLASSGACEAFVTFDAGFVKAAKAVSGAELRQP